MPEKKDLNFSPSRRHFLVLSAQIGATVSLATAVSGCELIPPPEITTRIMVPEGFKPRLVARSGYPSVVHSDYLWHPAPDGGGCFATEDGGWVYTSNSETDSQGGVGVLRFDANGQIIDSYPILQGTRRNCSGGETPWGTWLSCEEVPDGRVWECEPVNRQPARVRPLMGSFNHEAACVDPNTHYIYLTEDERDGCLYRYRPLDINLSGRSELDQGFLEIACMKDGYVNWREVPDPAATVQPTRYQVPQATRFNGGEGIDIYDNVIKFSTKGDNRIWALNLLDHSIQVMCDMSPYIQDVDDVTHTPVGNALIAEDGGQMRVYWLPTDEVNPLVLLRLPDHNHSEITGLAFSPDGSRLYFSSQRGNTDSGDNGLTFELSGDFTNLKADTPLVEWTLDHPGIIS